MNAQFLKGLGGKMLQKRNVANIWLLLITKSVRGFYDLAVCFFCNTRYILSFLFILIVKIAYFI